MMLGGVNQAEVLYQFQRTLNDVLVWNSARYINGEM